MGTNASKSRFTNCNKKRMNGHIRVCKQEEEGIKALDITEKQKELLLSAWKCLKDEMEKVGVVTFMQLFETHPEVKDAFLPFRGLSPLDMEQSAVLRAHALRVMMTVDKCLNRIDSPAKIENLMTELGGRHLNYNAKIEFIDMMTDQFIYAIQTNLGDRWSPEMEKAWYTLFGVMKYYMKGGLAKECSR